MNPLIPLVVSCLIQQTSVTFGPDLDCRQSCHKECHIFISLTLTSYPNFQPFNQYSSPGWPARATKRTDPWLSLDFFWVKYLTVYINLIGGVPNKVDSIS